MAGRLPLPTLLSQILVALTKDFEQAGAGTPPVPSLTMWSNVLQHVDRDGVDQRRLPELGRISKRAARQAVGALERSGLITVDAKIVRLTALGEQAGDKWRQLPRAVEKSWRKRSGEKATDGLRGVLEELVPQFKFELSHYPTGYGMADHSVTGGPGQDWAFWPRTDTGTVAGLPLSALLSQALVGFAIDYERAARFPLAWAAGVVQFLPDEGKLNDFLDFGITGNGKSVLERHGYVVVGPDPTDKKRKVVRLTPLGRKTRDDYLPVVAQIEERWGDQFGKNLITSLRTSLEDLVGHIDTDLPHHPSMQLDLWAPGF